MNKTREAISIVEMRQQLNFMRLFYETYKTYKESLCVRIKYNKNDCFVL